MKRIWVLAAALGWAMLAAPGYPAAAPPGALQAIREYVDANLAWPPGSSRVDFLTEGPEPLPPEPDVTLRVEPAGNPDLIGDTVFRVKSFRDGSLLRTESVRTRIEVLQEVVCAARALPAGTILAAGDLRTVGRWVRRIHPQSLPGADAAAGKRLAVQVAPGAEILATMLREVPLVKRGDLVKMVFDNGLMHITTVGLSEEDGAAGSVVRVRNVTSNKVIYARVLSDALVGIEF